MNATTYVIGAGLSGLSTAVHLAKSGNNIHLIEAANYGGGRCRSYFDQTLDQRIDNGNHLVLSGNRAVHDYLSIINALDTMWSPEHAKFPFVDLETGERWSVCPDKGLIPWSLFSKSKRVPGSSLSEYLKGLNFAMAGPDKTVRECLDAEGVLYRKFWEPLAVSVLNTNPSEASAELLWPVLRETFGRGERACRPLIAKEGLSESFVDPAIRYLGECDCTASFSSRLKFIEIRENKISALKLTDETITIKGKDRVVLAVPPNVASEMVPNLSVPDEFRSIVNAHFKLPSEIVAPVSFIGLVGGVGHWLFVRDKIASVTISAAEDYVDLTPEKLARMLWSEITQTLEMENVPLGEYRIVKEKRATFAQTPEQNRKRSGPKTSLAGVFVAGDWTATGLPATIEGSLRSGENAAQEVLASL